MTDNILKLLSKTCILILLIFFGCGIVGCDDDDDKVGDLDKVEIVIQFPATEQGDIVNIPIDTPIQFNAVVKSDVFGELTWWLEEDRKSRSLNEFYTFKENGLYKVNFNFRRQASHKDEQTFIWVRVVGKVITDIKNDEVGCSVVEVNDQIHIITKPRKSYLDNGVVYYKIIDGEPANTTNLAAPNRVLDAKVLSDGSIFYQFTNGGLKVDNSNSAFHFSRCPNYYSAHIKEDVSEDIDVIGVDTEKSKIVWESFNLNGSLRETKILKEAKDYSGNNISYDDAMIVDDNNYLYMEFYRGNFEGSRCRKLCMGSLSSSDKVILENNNVELGEWYTGKFINVDSEIMLAYSLSSRNENNVFKLEEDYTLGWSRNFEKIGIVEYLDLFQNNEKRMLDNKMWGWKNKNGYVFLAQDKIVKADEENNWTEVKDFLTSRSRVIIDAVWKSDDSVLVLTNTKKLNEYGYFNKFYCTLYRLNLKGEFIDL